jgi:ABC-type glutathione transport system ATPase component
VDERAVAERRDGAPVKAAGDDTAVAVYARGLVKHYRSRAGVVEAVRGVDLSVEANEIFGSSAPMAPGSRRRCAC